MPPLSLYACEYFHSVQEIRNGGGSGSSLGVCRFCGSTATSGLLAAASVCEDPECQVGNKLTSR